MVVNQKWIGIGLIALAIIIIVMLVVVKSDVDERDTFLCTAVHSNPNINPTECPAHESNTSWFIIFAFVTAMIILGIGIYLILFTKKLNPKDLEKTEYKEVDLSKLDDLEKTIYSILKNNSGSMYQSDIIKETNMSKVKITRALDKLESKKVIDRKRRGMTNIIILR